MTDLLFICREGLHSHRFTSTTDYLLSQKDDDYLDKYLDNLDIENSRHDRIDTSAIADFENREIVKS